MVSRRQRKAPRLQFPPTSFPPSTTMFGRITFAFLVLTFAAFFCAQSVEAERGPKITNIVYFDIKHGDKDLGRSMCCRPPFV